MIVGLNGGLNGGCFEFVFLWFERCELDIWIVDSNHMVVKICEGSTVHGSLKSGMWFELGIWIVWFELNFLSFCGSN